jgi:hypothetical protein
MVRKGMRSTFGAVMLAAMFASAAPVHGVEAAELTDKSVATLMNFAWGLMPEKFTKPDKTVIEVDKAKKDQIVVPVAVARDVIKVAARSAKAQRCKMNEQMVINHRTLMSREEAKKQWSEQQMLYINQLHLFVVMLQTGSVTITEKEGENEIKTSEDDAVQPASAAVAADTPEAQAKAAEEAAKNLPDCTEEQKKAIKDEVTAYVKG